MTVFKNLMTLFVMFTLISVQTVMANGCPMQYKTIEVDGNVAAMMDCHQQQTTTQNENSGTSCAHCIACHMVYLNLEVSSLVEKEKVSFKNKVAEHARSSYFNLDAPPPKFTFS